GSTPERCSAGWSGPSIRNKSRVLGPGLQPWRTSPSYDTLPGLRRKYMTGTKGFDNELYIREQASFIRERMRRFEGRLYLEFGGKLLADFHAARVLPGYDPNVKVRLLKELQEDAEIVLCIHAGAIEHRKI